VPVGLTQHYIAGVKGVYGCTGLIIASDRGAFISHIWEAPGFRLLPANAATPPPPPFTPGVFAAGIMSVLRTGRNVGNNAPAFFSSQGLDTLIGTAAQPGPLNPIFRPRIFIITPFIQGSHNFLYAAQVDELGRQLSQLLGGAQYLVRGYSRISHGVSTGSTSVAGRFILEVDPAHQYSYPATNPPMIEQWGAYRLWVELFEVATVPFPVGRFPRPVGMRRDLASRAPTTWPTCKLVTTLSATPATARPASAPPAAAAAQPKPAPATSGKGTAAPAPAPAKPVA
jgi:hypothetical protein